MAYTFASPVDMQQLEILNLVIQVLSSDPGSPATGQIWFNSTSGLLKYYNGSAVVVIADNYIPLSQKGAASGVASLNGSTKVVEDPANAQTTAAASKIPLADGSGKIANGWLNTGSGNGLDADQLDGQHGSYYLSRSNHTGSQTASTISDFDTQVRTNRLDQMATPTSAVGMGAQRITNLATPSADSDAATKAYADSIASGLSYKDPVRAATTANITLSGEQTIDGVSVVAGDRVLVKDQSTGSQNGIYVCASGGWTRSTDFDTSAEAKPGSAVWVNEGTTNGDTGWVLTTNASITLGTTALTFTQYTGAGGITAGAGLSKTGSTFDVNVGTTTEIVSDAVEVKAPYKTRSSTHTIGDGSTNPIDITHSFGTRHVKATVFKNSGNYDEVGVDCQHPDTNTVRLVFGVTPTSNQYIVLLTAIG